MFSESCKWIMYMALYLCTRQHNEFRNPAQTWPCLLYKSAVCAITEKKVEQPGFAWQTETGRRWPCLCHQRSTYQSADSSPHKRLWQVQVSHFRMLSSVAAQNGETGDGCRLNRTDLSAELLAEQDRYWQDCLQLCRFMYFCVCVCVCVITNKGPVCRI